MEILKRTSIWLKKGEEIRNEKMNKMIKEKGLCPNHSPGGICCECVKNSDHPVGCQCYFCRPFG